MSELGIETGYQHIYPVKPEEQTGRLLEEERSRECLDKSAVRELVDTHISTMLANIREIDPLGDQAQFVLCAYFGIPQEIPYHDTSVIDENPDGIEIENIASLTGCSTYDITSIIKETLKAIAKPPQLSVTAHMSWEKIDKWKKRKKIIDAYLTALDEQNQ